MDAEHDHSMYDNMIEADDMSAAVDILWNVGLGELQPDSVPRGFPRGDPYQEGSQPSHLDAGGDGRCHFCSHQGSTAGLPYLVPGTSLLHYTCNWG